MRYGGANNKKNSVQRDQVLQEEKETLAKRSILINIIVVPFIPFLLAIGVSFYFFATALESKTVNGLKHVVGDHRDMIGSFLQERRADLELLTHTYTYNELNRGNTLERVFEILQRRSNAFIDLGLFNEQGVHMKYSGPYRLRGKNYKDAPWFREVMKNGVYVSDIFMGYRNVPHFVIAVKQKYTDTGIHAFEVNPDAFESENSEGNAVPDSGSGSESWVLRATIDTSYFNTLVCGVRIGKTGEAYIVNGEGVFQTKRRSDGIKIMEKDPDLKGFEIKNIPEKDILTFIKPSSHRIQYLYAVTNLKDGEWILVVRQEKNDAYKALHSAFYITLVIMIIGGAIILVMALYMTERIMKQIKDLSVEKERLGHQLIRAAQLAEIGEMAAGFAHEINNPLQIIKNEHALITMLFKAGVSEEVTAEAPRFSIPWEDYEDVKSSIDQISLQVDRCATITQAILKFGRKKDIRIQALSPHEIIPEIVKMVEKKARVHGIEMEMDVPEALPDFMADASQFQQVMLNLCNNAMDAVIERNGTTGGIVKIDARKTDEGMISIRITDDGAGISPENLQKIFSPFFTTKPVGKGTGLGLSVCFGIIQKAGGTMDVTSEMGEGTTFTITLPLSN